MHKTELVGQEGYERAGSEEETLSILDFILVITRNRRIIGMTTAICVAFALLIAIFSPSQYTALAKVIRETSPGRTVTYSDRRPFSDPKPDPHTT